MYPLAISAIQKGRVPFLAGLLAASLMPAGLVSPASAATRFVRNLNDSGPGSLRATLAGAVSGDTVTFPSSLSGTITLTTGEIDIARSLTLKGPGPATITVSGGNSSRVFAIVSGAKVLLYGLGITGGQDNSVDGGGGLFVTAGSTLDLRKSLISNNFSAQQGGGIENQGTVLMISSTVSGNSSYNLSGGIENSGTMMAVDSTVSGNTAVYIGGIDNLGGLRLVNCTITRNTADSIDGIVSGVYSYYGGARVESCLIAGNSPGQTIPPDLFGPFQSGGSNIIGVQDGQASGFGGNHDQVGTPDAPLDPRLGPLQDNGGFTPTIALLPDSPAIDADYNFAVPRDQRNVPRPPAGGNDRGDVGAYETAPIASADSYTTPENHLLTVLQPEGILNNDMDATVAILVAPPAHGALALTANGAFSYQPESGFHGIDTFSYAAGDGVKTGTPAVVTLTVTGP